MHSQSVMLTEIGRSLETKVPLKKIEERFCHFFHASVFNFTQKKFIVHLSQTTAPGKVVFRGALKYL